MSDPYRRRDDEDLAYGQDYSGDRGYNNQPGGQGQQQGDERGIIGDTFKKFKTRYDQYSSQQRPPGQDYGYGSTSTVNSQNYSGSGYGGGSGTQQPYSQQQTQAGQPAYPGGPPPSKPQAKPDFADKFLGGLIGSVTSIGADVQNIIGGSHGKPQGQRPPQGYQQGLQSNLQPQVPTGPTQHRFDSTFAGPKPGNDVKWYVDGCSYMWAVSQALENARQTIWILDWWLTPELYLRRPPAKNEEWRIDKVLLRAANRGVKVNIIVYKEVTQALTLSSAHTKHALEALSPNIGVFRHPDHLPDAQTAHSSILSSLQGLKLDAAGASKLGADALKGIYGITDGVILYWAHHEKLCLIDGAVAFMGGLDLCFGRWDTNQHPISDAHPSDLNKIVFPGQDFNNARVMDFSDVSQPFQNKLDRTKSSRMGWSDISICLKGPCVGDLIHHFVDRWNVIYDEKYNVRKDVRYQRLPDYPDHRTNEGPRPEPGNNQSVPQKQGQQGGSFPPPPTQSGNTGYTQPAWQSSSQPSTFGSSATGAPAGAAIGGAAVYGSQSGSTQPGYNQQGGQQNFPPPPPGPPPANQGQYGQSQPQGYQSQPLGQQQGQYGQSQPQGYSQPPSQQSSQSPGQYGAGGAQSQYPQSTASPRPQDQQAGYSRPAATSQPPALGQGQYSSPSQTQVSPQAPFGASQQPSQAYSQSSQQGQGQSNYAAGAYQSSQPQPTASAQPGQQYSGYPQASQSPRPGQTQYPGQPAPTFTPPPQSAQQSQGQYQSPPQSEARIASQQYAAYTSQGPSGAQGPIELGTAPSPQYQTYSGQPTARGLEEPSEYGSVYSGERGFGGSYDQERHEYDQGGERGYADDRGQYEYDRGERGYGDSFDRGRQDYGYEQGDERAFGRKPAASPGGRFDRYKDEALRYTEGKKLLGHDIGKYTTMIDDKIERRYGHSNSSRPGTASGAMSCQLVRSCTKWSNGTPTEHSVQNAYIELIQNSKHFIYIENQFFITATGNKQKPVKNMIGKALVERIIRAAREQQPFKIIVNIPSVPAFAGDLVDDGSLGTRAIMEFQYNSICRGGNSIMEEVAKAGYNPMDYIRFYNLRNYDRINVTPAMQQAQQQTGVGYDDARRQFESQLGSGYGGYGETAAPTGQPGQQQPYGTQQGQAQGQPRAGPGGYQPGQPGQPGYQNQPGQQPGQSGYNTTQPGGYQPLGQQGSYQPPGSQSGYQQTSQQGGYSSGQQGSYQPQGQQSGYGSQQIPSHHGSDQYQQAAQNAPHVKADDWDTVSSCYMLGGQDIRNVPWSGPPESELDAFVSEELYIHSKVMIVDDQTVICGSANLNDRSMLGTHDSEIALVIQDTTPIQSTMAGRPWQANRFAASLRRQLFRKHLGLIRPQDMENPNENSMPVGVAPNLYDWGTPEDNIVADPLSDAFQSLWNSRARTNTEVFRKAFRAVPDDTVKSWPEYKEFYEYYFAKADAQAVGKDEKKKQARVEYGHVVRSDFPGGVRELKELLSRVKGTLVEMPLCFLQTEDIAKENMSFNALTAELYT